jgi:hypothetical protein
VYHEIIVISIFMKRIIFCCSLSLCFYLCAISQDTTSKVKIYERKFALGPGSGMGTGHPNNPRTNVIRNKSKGTGDFDETGGVIFKRKIISRDINNFKEDLTIKGRVGVKVCIDRAGVVTFAEIIKEESTIKDPSTLDVFLKAARSYRFRTLLIVPDEQCGKLMFVDGLHLETQKFLEIKVDSVLLDDATGLTHVSEIGLELIKNENAPEIEISEYGTVYVRAFFSADGRLLSLQFRRDLSSIKDDEIHQQCTRSLINYRVDPKLLKSKDNSCIIVFSTD